MNYLYLNQKYLSEIPEKHAGGKILLVPEPWLFFRKKIEQKICHLFLSPHINSIIRLPLRKYWLKRIIRDSFDDKDELCIIVNAHFYHLYYSDIRRIAESFYKTVHCVFVFSDKVDYFQGHYKDFPSLNELSKYFDAVITYNIHDSERYNLVLDRPCFPCFPKVDNNLIGYKSDLFFVGSDKGRLNELYRIFELCESSGIKCDFHIVGVPKNKIKYQDKIVFNRPMPYSEVLERSSKTNCILYVVQDNGSGIVLRDYEALTFNKRLLTNNKGLLAAGFYSKEQVIWIEELEERKGELLEKPVIHKSFSDEYSLENWLKWLDTIIANDE